MYFAHSGPTQERWEPLADHLRDVAERAASFAAAFGAADEARAAGLLHDLGKYSDLFTLRLEGKAKGLDHWSPGAWLALTHYRQAGLAAALAIQGHHIGLQQADEDALRGLNPESLRQRHPLGLRLTEVDCALLRGRLEDDGLELPAPRGTLYDPHAPAGAGMLDVRMLFSTLVDADFLETEAHFERRPDGSKGHRPASPNLRPDAALARLEEEVARLARGGRAAAGIQSLRADLFRVCLTAATLPPGLFTLTAPTGAGKTLAMLAFALRHAREHGMRRVVVALPYLSIIEQTARVYRDLLEPLAGSLYLLEHHSLAGTKPEAPPGPERRDDQAEERRRARWQAENWDAPLVVTTSVQLLESLFAARPAACRKLHRLAGSVILLDEVQTLPPRLAKPVLAALSRLAERYRASVVFSTATQPAFDHLDATVRELAPGGWRPREIVPAHLGLFERARRTRAVWDLDPPKPWGALADELLDHGRAVLCIVNLKRHARDLAAALRSRGAAGLFHLSTNMCPAHREKVLAEVRRRLEASEPCLLVSTQCVEAGVDVDFPLVYRAFGPLDAIAQAAGRCNRNGRNPEPGEVRVFLPVPEEERYPPGGYKEATGVTRSLLGLLGPEGMDLQSPDLFRRYYRMLYDLTGVAAGAQGKAKALEEAIRAKDFAETAQLFRLIDQDAISVLVPYDPEEYASLTAELKELGHPTRDWIRRARPHAVSLIRPQPDDPLWNLLQPASPSREEERQRSEEWWIYLAAEHYDRELLGLMEAEGVWIA